MYLFHFLLYKTSSLNFIQIYKATSEPLQNLITVHWEIHGYKIINVFIKSINEYEKIQKSPAYRNGVSFHKQLCLEPVNL